MMLSTSRGLAEQLIEQPCYDLYVNSPSEQSNEGSINEEFIAVLNVFRTVRLGQKKLNYVRQTEDTY